MNISKYIGLNNGSGDELWLIDATLFTTGFPTPTFGFINYNYLKTFIPGFDEATHVNKIKFRNGDLKYTIAYADENGDALESAVIEARRPNDANFNNDLFLSLNNKLFVVVFHSYNAFSGQRAKVLFGTKDEPMSFRFASRNGGSSFAEGSEQGFVGMRKAKTPATFLRFS